MKIAVGRSHLYLTSGVPISGLGQTMNAKTYRCVLCYRLGVPLFSISTTCSAYSRVFAEDIFGDHAVSCAGIVGIKHRHNVVRDTLADVCIGLEFRQEKRLILDCLKGMTELCELQTCYSILGTRVVMCVLT